jgi:hypothetical protein
MIWIVYTHFMGQCWCSCRKMRWTIVFGTPISRKHCLTNLTDFLQTVKACNTAAALSFLVEPRGLPDRLCWHLALFGHVSSPSSFSPSWLPTRLLLAPAVETYPDLWPGSSPARCSNYFILSVEHLISVSTTKMCLYVTNASLQSGWLHHDPRFHNL